MMRIPALRAWLWGWIDLALAFVRTLPPKPAKPAAPSKKTKARR
jgi:hypothetical protein